MIIDDLEALDAPAARIARAWNPVMRSPVKPLLRGDWLGHAVHPLATDVVVGAFTSALVLDLLGGDEDAAATLIATGLAAAPVTAWTGWSDWHDEEAASPAIRRTGLVHAAAIGSALGLQLASLGARRGGSRGRGVALSLAAMGLTGAAGWLGGHMTYAKGARVETDPARADL